MLDLHPAFDFNRRWMKHKSARSFIRKGVAKCRVSIMPPEIFTHPPMLHLARVGTAAPPLLSDMDKVLIVSKDFGRNCVAIKITPPPNDRIKGNNKPPLFHAHMGAKQFPQSAPVSHNGCFGGFD